MKHWLSFLIVGMLAFGGAIFGQSTRESRCFELRTYTVATGKFEALHRRFQDHAIPLFKKHGITVIGFWVPTDQPNTLMYMLGHATCDAAPASWKAFFDDPAWIAARDTSEKDGPLVTKVEKVFMNPTEYSPLK